MIRSELRSRNKWNWMLSTSHGNVALSLAAFVLHVKTTKGRFRPLPNWRGLKISLLSFHAYISSFMQAVQCNYVIFFRAFHSWSLSPAMRLHPLFKDTESDFLQFRFRLQTQRSSILSSVPSRIPARFHAGSSDFAESESLQSHFARVMQSVTGLYPPPDVERRHSSTAGGSLVWLVTPQRRKCRPEPR